MGLNEKIAHQFRVTKYNPAYRDRNGAYQQDEWISYGDIGKTFGGVTLSQTGYEAVESAYMTAAIGFLNEAGIDELRICGLENSSGDSSAPADGSSITLSELRDALRSVLREKYWCRFEGESAFVHVGYDYYMYVGVPDPCEAAQAEAQSMGLFVEPFSSPYLSNT